MSRLIECPSCSQEYDIEVDENCIYLHVCNKFICVCCFKEHIKICPLYLGSNEALNSELDAQLDRNLGGGKI